MSGSVDKLPDFSPNFQDVPLHISGKSFKTPQIRYVLGENRWQGHAVNLPYLLEHGKGCRIILKGYFQRSEYFLPHKQKIQSWFKMPPLNLPVELGSEDLLVHIRRSVDYFVLNQALDISYYTDLLSGLSFNRLFVIGLGIDENVKRVLNKFRPEFLELDASRSLALMTRAHRFVMSNSTFAWWGAFLSGAKEIYYPRPRCGVWSTETPEISLEVPETRYQVIDQAPVEVWRPFHMLSTTSFRQANTKEGKLHMLVCVGERAVRIEIAQNLALMVNRFSELDSPFGLSDFADLELSGRMRLELVKLLSILQRIGAIRSVPGTFKALAGAAQGMRGF